MTVYGNEGEIISLILAIDMDLTILIEWDSNQFDMF